MMTASAPIPKDHQLKMAWDAYRETDDAKNSEKWAKTMAVEQVDGGIMIYHPHTEGAIWAAFMAGFVAGGGEI